MAPGKISFAYKSYEDLQDFTIHGTLGKTRISKPISKKKSTSTPIKVEDFDETFEMRQTATTNCKYQACNKCNKSGHSAPSCPKGRICKTCGVSGHTAFYCATPRDEWYCRCCGVTGHHPMQFCKNMQCDLCGRQEHFSENCKLRHASPNGWCAECILAEENRRHEM